MSDAKTRTGFETFTGAFLPVVYDQDRAAQDLPPWTATGRGQFFTDSEVDETTVPMAVSR